MNSCFRERLLQLLETKGKSAICAKTYIPFRLACAQQAAQRLNLPRVATKVRNDLKLRPAS